MAETYDGFCFVHIRPDLNARDGVRKTWIIAVARDVSEALDLAGEFLPAESLALVDQGASVLKEAKERGISDGRAAVL